MERGGGSGIGGMPGAPQNILDAGAQEYYPAIGAAYPFPPLQHQQLYCPRPPVTYPVMPPPAPMPMPMAMPMPMPPPHTVAISQQFGIPMPAAAATASVDGPPSRAVVLSLLTPHRPEAEVARAMAPFGDVRAVDSLALASEGVATVHFFDLRAAERAVAAVREQHMRQQCRLSQHYAAMGAWPPQQPPALVCHQDDGLGLVLGQAVWANFAAGSSLPDGGPNGGSLIVLNCLPDVSLSELRQAFQAYGDLKDVREPSHRSSHKFLDFFDSRDAARALAELNGRDFFGHRLLLEYTRPSIPGVRRSAHVPQRPMAPTPPRLQSTWRPLPAPAKPPPPAPPSSGAGKAREGVVLLRRRSPKSSASDQSKGGNNAGTSQERKGKRGKNITIVVNATSSSPASPSESSSPASATASASGKQQCTKAVGRSGSWRHGWETRYEFKQPDADNNAATGGAATDSNTQEPETRTTVMIRNIPNNQKLLLNMLDNHCIEFNKKIDAGQGEGEFEGQPFSSYDFLYLPIDFSNKCNVGYGFVNLTSPEAAVRLYKAFHKQPWEVYNSRKICQVTYARLQGLEALKEHFKNSKFPCDNDEYLPVVFSPPRDGRQLTEPELLVPRTPVSSSSSSLPANVDPLALELMAPPSSSGDGASSTMSTHADDEVHGDDSNEDDDDDGLGEELQRLGYTD